MCIRFILVEVRIAVGGAPITIGRERMRQRPSRSIKGRVVFHFGVCALAERQPDVSLVLVFDRPKGQRCDITPKTKSASDVIINLLRSDC